MNEEIFNRLCASRKYGDVHPDAIRRAIEDAERRYRKPKDIEKAARERLHGVTSAFNGLGGAAGKATAKAGFGLRSPARLQGKASNASVESEASSARVESEASDASVEGEASSAGIKRKALNARVESEVPNASAESVASNASAESVASNASAESVASNASAESVASNASAESGALNAGIEGKALNASVEIEASGASVEIEASGANVEGKASSAGIEGEASSAGVEGEASGVRFTPNLPPTGALDDLEALLARHASTRERLPLARVDALYGRIFAVTGAPRSVLDLACGLNPLYLLRRCDCPVTGVDVSRACVELLSHELNFTGIWADLLSEGAIPAGRFHIALLFKILPLLERQRAGAASEIMGKIDAEYLVASFPTRTLGGRNVNMERNYTEWMEAHLPANRRVEARFADENELFYILREVPGASDAKEK